MDAESEYEIKRGDAVQMIQTIQSMIDVSAERLKGLRTQCLTSAELTQQEIRTLEGKLVKHFSHQLAIKARIGEELARELGEVPCLAQWLRVVGLSPESIESACSKVSNLEALRERSEHELRALLPRARDEEVRRLCRAMQRLRTYTDAIARGAGGAETAEMQLYWDSWERQRASPRVRTRLSHTEHHEHHRAKGGKSPTEQPAPAPPPAPAAPAVETPISKSRSHESQLSVRPEGNDLSDNSQSSAAAEGSPPASPHEDPPPKPANNINHNNVYGLECGVRQGGITSPKLFNLYMDELIGELSSMHAGCYVDGKSCNNFSYADDMVLLSPSTGGLVKLLGACEQYAEKHGLKYNVTKSEIMIFKTENKLPQEIPSFLLCKNELNCVTRFKYLGHIVTDDLKDDEDIERERRALAVRANMLARRFARCTREVKVTLFRAYCQSFYTCSLWVNYTQRAINSLRVQYNNAFRMLLGLPRHCSASGMFAEARVDGFHAIVRKRTASLLSRVRGSTNNILAVIAGRLDGPILKHWVSVIIGTLTVCGKSSRPIATLP
ncbi:unnamed protein product [Plutella xylostella]|uniref:(diamondback moth) hypothetical protein n=1 Tax=Plutella xylostella TaxID=51655 RepID=A0A8S4DRV9_PLUXY|nr:unnamed protein product [Plutella xylostella]